MPIRVNVVEVCDAITADSSTAADKQNVVNKKNAEPYVPHSISYILVATKTSDSSAFLHSGLTVF